MIRDDDIFRHCAVGAAADRLARLAEHEQALMAVPAVAARDHGSQRDHLVADGKAGHVLAHRLDNAGVLMAQRHRWIAGVLVVHDVDVGAADAGRHDTDQQLVILRFGPGYVNHRETRHPAFLVLLDQRFHAVPPASVK
ncbi:hypothetical protein SDC9_206651 [bioreactor metagenome]|uniref:Uncharacterized protein n=1 Tax=bioreactor metagenome TaxID=1076179 RepID=A0A645J5D9_9ZZZZ